MLKRIQIPEELFGDLMWDKNLTESCINPCSTSQTASSTSVFFKFKQLPVLEFVRDGAAHYLCYEVEETNGK
jgi:hypothetical protein